MNILVTGGAGYIGSHTCKLLYKHGFTPIVFDNLSTGNKNFVKWGPLVIGDLSDYSLIRKTIREYNIQAVIHFAASAYVGESMDNPRKYFYNNTVNTLNLINAMEDENLKKIVFSSTCATYGIPEEVPIRESFEQKPINPYGESKLMIERILHWYGNAYGLRYVSLRYFNAAGADPEIEIGELHDPETHLIPIVIEAALGQREFVEVYGTDYPTPDGTAIRDYIHVMDLASAHVLSLKYLLDGGDSVYLNLGTGKGFSVRQVIRAVERLSGKKINVRNAKRRQGDPAVLVANPDLAKDLLGWEPLYQDIETIIDTAWQWARRRSSFES
ncbi:UDP-glucose 4-epimerase GalE [Geobacillus thermoleovorans]|uniref:UDP-glucose 4-epimerase GalE n=1 Tax=Geobacillus thermoleovorans TaxID=33941 RepID=UPI003DA5756C